jgi:hypothetical protein
MHRVAARLRCSADAGIMVAALVIAASSCVSCTHNVSVEAERGATEGFVEGLKCGPAFVICSPVLAAGVAAGGAATEVIKEAYWSGNKQQMAASRSKQPDLPRRFIRNWMYFGELTTSDFSPTGILQIDANQITGAGNLRTGTLLMNLPEREEAPIGSVEVDMVADCATHFVTFGERRTYEKRNGLGLLIKSEQALNGIAPGPQLESIVKTFCNRLT